MRDPARDPTKISIWQKKKDQLLRLLLLHKNFSRSPRGPFEIIILLILILILIIVLFCEIVGATAAGILGFVIKKKPLESFFFFSMSAFPL